MSYFTLRASLILKVTIRDLYKRLIMKAAAAPVGTPWMWTPAFGHHHDRTPTHGYEATRDAAMAACREELAEGMRWIGRTACARSVLFCSVSQ